MNENLRWLAINAPDWDNNFDRIARGSVGVDWFSSERFPGRIGFSREELRVAKAELSGERMDNIARNGNDGEHYFSDITAYDPPGPTSMPGCTFTTPDEDEAWAEAERRMDAIGQNGNDGLHYNPEDVAFVRAEGKQPRYQDTAGEDWIDEAARTFTAEEFRGAMRFSIGKYNRRMGKKDDLIKEIEKMRDYCQRWIDVEKSR
jgi:hypothetical protein